MRHHTDRGWAIAASLALAISFADAAHARGTDRCYSAVVPAMVILPVGALRSAGQLRICSAGELNPATTLHEVQWNGVALGLFLAHSGAIEGPALREGSVVFVFARAADSSALVLEGYALGDGTKARTFDLTPRGRVSSHWVLTRAVARANAPGDDDRILVAAV